MLLDVRLGLWTSVINRLIGNLLSNDLPQAEWVNGGTMKNLKTPNYWKLYFENILKRKVCSFFEKTDTTDTMGGDKQFKFF